MSEVEDIATMKVQLRYLSEKLTNDERDYAKREANLWTHVKALEQKNRELQSSIKVGKGVFIGIFFTIGTIGITAFDKLRETIIKFL